MHAIVRIQRVRPLSPGIGAQVAILVLIALFLLAASVPIALHPGADALHHALPLH